MAAPAASGEAPGAGAILFAALVGVVVLGAAFAGDASDVGGTLPVGGAAVVLLVAALVLVAFGVLPLPRVGRSGAALLGAATALVAWTGTTVLWSIVPDRSWDVFNRGVAFLAFLGLGVLLATVGGRLASRLAASLLAIITAAVLAWALLSKVVPSLDPEGDRVARLREPVGYWNALALLADMALVLGLWLAASRGHRPPVRVAGALLVYAATLSLMLTVSRAGVIAGVAVVALWLALTRERLESALLLAAAAVPAVLVGAWAFTRPALVEDVALRSDREADGVVLGVLVLVGAALVVLLAVVALRRVDVLERRGGGRVLLALGAVLAAAGVAALAVGVADTLSSGRDCAEVVNDPGRFGSLESARLCWWGEALDVFSGHAPGGAGAGSFEVARKRYRVDARPVLQPHSVPLQQLADGGVVGLLLFLALGAAAAAVCVCALRRLGGEERPAALALVAAAAAYLLHALVDYNWDFLAVTAPTMVALGVLAGAGRDAGPIVRRPLLAVGAVLAALVVLVSFSSPRLSDRSVRASTRALDGDLERARDYADRARLWNPLSVDPVFALARVEERRRDLAAAARRYREAVDLQPENPETLYALGLFELEARERMCDAYRYLNDAYTLDPSGNQWIPGGPLDVAREAVNAGACER